MNHKLETDQAGLDRDLIDLSKFSSGESPGITRVLYTTEDKQARQFLTAKCEEAGLQIQTDPVGNIFATWLGSSEGAPRIGTGSHIDAIPQSGMYDGTVGVMGGLEAIRSLQRSGFRPTHSVELVMFTSEEPTRFGIGCLGSRMIVGNLDPNEASGLHDGEGNSLADLRDAFGLSGALDQVELPENYYKAFVELHIEQGPHLEASKLDLGVVTKIAAPSTLRVNIKGEGGHAGAVLMPVRKDAGSAAAEISLAVERLAIQSASPDTVGTTGIFKILPGAVNSIPSQAYLEIDLRDTSELSRDGILSGIQQEIQDICSRRRVKASVEILNSDPPLVCDPEVVEIILEASVDLGYSSQKMISRAYHDSLFMGQKFPTSMIFIPCRGGVSHRPDEFSSSNQIRKGVETLATTLMKLSR